MDIKISVIIPVYNVEKYITKTMESLISQTLKEFELILVDDGSKDSSIELAEGILKGSHINYRVIKKVNEGVSRARNTGIDIAQGTYIYFLDSDDYIEDTLLEKMYHCAQKERAQVVFCGYTHISDEVEHNSNFIKPLLKVHKYLEKPISGIEAAEKMLRNEFWISAISGLYLRSYIKEKNIYFDENIKFGEDTIFAIKALINADKVASVNEALAYYVRRGTSVTKTGDKKYFDLHKSNIEILNYNRENFRAYDVEKALLEYKIPHSIIRIFSSLSKSGKNKDDLFKFINDNNIRSYLKGFKVSDNKENIKFKVAAYMILYFPHIAYNLFKMKEK